MDPVDRPSEGIAQRLGIEGLVTEAFHQYDAQVQGDEE
jgi:hypothetical protein